MKANLVLKLDHLCIIAPSLEEGAAYIQEELGISLSPGGAHLEMGTHNLLLRLRDARSAYNREKDAPDLFLEVIACNPKAAPPSFMRWFELGDHKAVRRQWDAGKRLRSFVARCEGVDVQSAAQAFDLMAAREKNLWGSIRHVSRGDRSWRFLMRADGALPAEGMAPHALDWGERGAPAGDMPDLSANLESFFVEHPEPSVLRALYMRIGLCDPPEIRQAQHRRFAAKIMTPLGAVEIS